MLYVDQNNTIFKQMSQLYSIQVGLCLIQNRSTLCLSHVIVVCIFLVNIYILQNENLLGEYNETDFNMYPSSNIKIFG